MRDRHITPTGQLTALLLGLLVITAGVATPALAASSDDEESLSEKASDLLGGGTTLAKASGSVFMAVMSNLDYQIERFGDYEPARNPSECAGDISSEVNNHSAAYEEYINKRVAASNNTDVIEVRCRYAENGELTTSTVYIVADVANGEYQNLSAVSSTNRTVDETVVLTGKATEEMPDELVTFREDYVATNTTPPKSYEPKLGSKYASYVHGTPSFLPPLSDLEEGS